MREAGEGKLGTPKRAPLSTRVRDALLDHILQGNVKPGERLLEMRLAEQMGTSQAPVREALRELEMLGIVETSRNRGTRVRAPTARELAEIYDLRAELEGYAASLTAGSFADVGGLNDCVAVMLDCAERSDLQGFAEANTKFHRLIVTAAGNRTLLDMWTKLDVRSRSTVNMLRMHRDLATIAKSHYPIIRALESGKPAEARRALRKHVLSFRPSEDAESVGPGGQEGD